MKKVTFQQPVLFTKTKRRGGGKVSSELRTMQQVVMFKGKSVCLVYKTAKTDLVVTTLFTITELQVVLEHSERQPEDKYQPRQTHFEAAGTEKDLVCACQNKPTSPILSEHLACSIY